MAFSQVLRILRSISVLLEVVRAQFSLKQRHGASHGRQVTHNDDGKFLNGHFFHHLSHNQDLREAQNVCLSITESCVGVRGTSDVGTDEFMSKHLHAKAMPRDCLHQPEDPDESTCPHKIFESAFLLTRSSSTSSFDSHVTAFARSADEWVEDLVPIFDGIADLKERNDASWRQKNRGVEVKELFSALLLPQIPSAYRLMEVSSFDSDVLDALIDTAGSGAAQKMFCEDIKKEETVCFRKVIHYWHRPVDHTLDRMNKAGHAITSSIAAAALRKTSRLPNTPSRGRKAVLIQRSDHLGWTNYQEVEDKLRERLEKMCWTLSKVLFDDSPVDLVIQHLKDADLVFSKHNPHNENMIWMPQNAAFIEDKNCVCSTHSYAQLAEQQGLKYVETSGDIVDGPECEKERFGLGVCMKNKPRTVNFEKEIQPALDEMIQDLETTRPSDRKDKCIKERDLNEM